MVRLGERVVSIAAILLAGSSAASSGIVLSPTTASSQGGGARTATYRIGSDGYVYAGDNGVFTQQYQWKQNSNASSDYEALLSLDLGSVTGTTGSWLGLGSNADWSVTDLTVDGEGRISSGTISIRNASTLEVLATENVDFYADRWS